MTIAQASPLPAHIFRAYDIRGIVGDALTPDIVRRIGGAIGAEAHRRGARTLVVGRDGRNSGAELRTALVEGLRESGRDVVDVGRVPSPVLYFAAEHLETGSGVMVTGSHNPADYNGLKIVLAGDTLHGDAIQDLRRRIEEDDLDSGREVRGRGRLRDAGVVGDYIRRICTEIPPVPARKARKIVIDCGNGVAGDVAPRLFRALGHDVVELYCEVDGDFPNHHPNPSEPENLRDLVASVREHGADLGLAFDGDGDRLGVVDGEGNIIWPDRQMMLFASDVLASRPGAESSSTSSARGCSPSTSRRSGAGRSWPRRAIRSSRRSSGRPVRRSRAR